MNLKFDFYTGLLNLIKSEIFLKTPADDLVEIYQKKNTGITLQDVSRDTIEGWHMVYHIESRDQDEIEGITECVFEDLASQMRSEEVRSLLTKWKSAAGIPDDLFVRVRKIKDLGDGVAAITIVTDDVTKFRKFWQDPDEYIRMDGYVHYSEADEAKDPV